MNLEKVNELQGKAKNRTDSTYFMVNPDDLKYEYVQHLPALTITQEVERLSIKSPEYIEMENENKKLKEELGELRGEISYIKTALGDKLK